MKLSRKFYTVFCLLPSFVLTQSIPDGLKYTRTSTRNCDVPISAAFISNGSALEISYNKVVPLTSRTVCIVCSKFEWKYPDYAWISSVDYEGQIEVESGLTANIDLQIAEYAGSYLQTYTPIKIAGPTATTAFKAHHSNSTMPEILYQQYQPGMELCIRMEFSVAPAADVSKQTTSVSGIGPLVQRLELMWAKVEPWSFCKRDRSGKPVCYGDAKDPSCCNGADS